MIEILHKYLDKLEGTKLKEINLVCQMLILDFDSFGIHFQSFTRISKNNDLLFTTLDYQSWDGKEDINNDEKFFFDKYKNEIINGVVVKVNYNKFNDLIIFLDNGIVIETFVSNGYNHFVEEIEQYRLLIDTDKEENKHIIVYNKHIEIL